MNSRQQNMLFLIVGFLSVLVGLGITISFMGKAFSQAPSENLPPELGGAVAPGKTDLPGSPSFSSPANNPAPSEPINSALPLPPPSLPVDTSGGVVELPNNMNPADAGPIDEYVRPQAVDGYTYDPTGKRDPFRPFINAGKLGVGRANLQVTNQPEVELEPLQKFELGTLEVVGIVWDVSKPKALIRDPNKMVYTVKKGQKIGKNDGYIAEIREGEVIVIETFEDQGKLVKDARVLAIKK